MKSGSVVLSKRLKTLADMVSRDSRVVDVGCDHGFVSVYLVQNGISRKVLAMDVRKGPLSRAQEHIAEYGLENYIETRLSDGLKEYREGEADTLVCAGMGGRLMMRILAESEEKAKGFKELILQPQSELPQFRKFLRENGYRTEDENILMEDGKYYFLFKVCPGARCGETGEPDGMPLTEEICDKYGKRLLQQRHPVLFQYLQQNLQTAEQIRNSLKENKKSGRIADRLIQVEQEMEDLLYVLRTVYGRESMVTCIRMNEGGGAAAAPVNDTGTEG